MYEPVPKYCSPAKCLSIDKCSSKGDVLWFEEYAYNPAQIWPFCLSLIGFCLNRGKYCSFWMWVFWEASRLKIWSPARVAVESDWVEGLKPHKHMSPYLNGAWDVEAGCRQEVPWGFILEGISWFLGQPLPSCSLPLPLPWAKLLLSTQCPEVTWSYGYGWRAPTQRAKRKTFSSVRLFFTMHFFQHSQELTQVWSNFIFSKC